MRTLYMREKRSREKKNDARWRRGLRLYLVRVAGYHDRDLVKKHLETGELNAKIYHHRVEGGKFPRSLRRYAGLTNDPFYSVLQVLP